MDRLPPDAQKLLEQLRHLDDPTPEERRRADAGLRGALADQGLRKLPSLAVLAPAASQLPAAAAVRWSDAGVKLLWASTAVMIVALGFWGARTWRSSERPASDLASQQPAQLQAAQPKSIPLQPAPAAVEPAAPPSMAAAPAPFPAWPATPDARRQPSHAQRALAHSPSAAPDSLAEELRFLASVDADIRGGAYDRALQRLAARNKAPSPLQEERAAMRVLALCGRDHDSAAARAGDQFLKRAPSSLLATRVRAACKELP